MDPSSGSSWMDYFTALLIVIVLSEVLCVTVVTCSGRPRNVQMLYGLLLLHTWYRSSLAPSCRGLGSRLVSLHDELLGTGKSGCIVLYYDLAAENSGTNMIVVGRCLDVKFDKIDDKTHNNWHD